MATSGSADFSITRNDLVKYALINLGVLGEGETPSSTQYTDGAMILNMIVKAWHADGMPLWARKQTSFALTATTTYNIGVGQTINTARPLKIYNSFLRNSSDIDRQITLLPREEYDRLSSKQTEGIPTALFYDPQGGATAYGTINLWPKPDTTAIADYTCFITYQRPFEDFDGATDTPDFPQEWYMALLWMLSWAISPSYGIPPKERAQFLEEAVRLKLEALSFGMEEGSVIIGPKF
jgi:hypothetical protein